jgi:hypothetical protein
MVNRPEPIRPMTLGNHGHPRIQCTQTAVPTAIAKNSGSATAKPIAFASISAPALPVVGTKSHRTHSDNVPVPSFGPRMRCNRRGRFSGALPTLLYPGH